MSKDSNGKRHLIPMISGAHLWYSNPPKPEYCESMLKLHGKPWRSLTEIPIGEAAVAKFNEWRASADFPDHLKREIAKQTKEPAATPYVEGDAYEYDENEPEWLDLLGARMSDVDAMIDGSFKPDNFTTHSNVDQSIHVKPRALGCEAYASGEPLDAIRHAERWWSTQVELARMARQRDASLGLNARPEDDPWNANGQQRKAIALVLYTLYMQFHTPEHRMPDALHANLLTLIEQRTLKDAFGRRVLLLGKPGSGKSFVERCCTTLVRMVANRRRAAIVGAPTGIAGFVAGGCTWHSLLGIPVGPRFLQSFAEQAGSVEKQALLEHLIAVFGDETSLTGRTLFGWIANLLRINVAHGRGEEEPGGGKHLPIWMQCGDWYQLDPVLDTSLLNDAMRNPNSNYGRLVCGP